ncbi:MAG: ABC transporter substrate-binding protein, partial [bacterium]
MGTASLVLAACSDDSGTSNASSGEDGGNDSEEVQREVSGQLHLGTLLPETGSLEFLGPPLFAGVDLAVQDVNAAGGVGGQEIVVTHRDSHDTSTDTAVQGAEELIGQGVSAIIGPASSAVSMTVIDQITGSGTVMVSPSNTATSFTDYPDDGMYFRTAPSDVLQGRVLGELVRSDGHDDVGIMALDDAYGDGLAENVSAAVEEDGGTIVDQIRYDPQGASFTTEVTQMVTARPEALVLIGFVETLSILPELEAQGIGPQDLPVYFVDGNLSNYGEDLPEGFLAGSKGTLPGSDAGEQFQERLLEVNPDLNDFSYAAEAYDAVMLTALSAVSAGSFESQDIANAMVEVSRNGTECTSFEECVQLLQDGEDIDYNGASGPITFSPDGDITEGSVGIYQYGEDNTYENIEYRSGT